MLRQHSLRPRGRSSEESDVVNGTCFADEDAERDDCVRALINFAVKAPFIVWILQQLAQVGSQLRVNWKMTCGKGHDRGRILLRVHFDFKLLLFHLVLLLSLGSCNNLCLAFFCRIQLTVILFNLSYFKLASRFGRCFVDHAGSFY